MTNDERILNLSATVRSLADLCTKLQEENDFLREQLDDDTHEIGCLENSLDNLDNECQTLRGELQRVRVERDQLKRKCEDLETELDLLRYEYKQADSQNEFLWEEVKKSAN